MTLTEHEKQTILRSYEMGISPKQIAAQLGKTPSAITSYHSRIKKISGLPIAFKTPKRIISGPTARNLKRLLLDDPKLSVRRVTAKLHQTIEDGSVRPSKDSVRRFLLENDFRNVVSELKPPLTAGNKLKRLAFARHWLTNGVCTLENVIWTDETRVASHPNNVKISHWTRSKTKPIQIKKHSGGASIMFWGSFSKHGLGSITTVVGSMNSAQYIEILREKLIPEYQHCQVTYPGVWRLMQDNAPCHTANATKAFLRTKRVEFIDWPPYSLDLNPIENLLAWMKHKLITEFPECQTEDDIIRQFLKFGNQSHRKCAPPIAADTRDG